MTVNSIAQPNCETKGPNWLERGVKWAKKNPGKAALAIFLASPTPTTTAAAVGLVTGKQIGDAWVKHSAKMEADNTKKTEKEIDSATKDHTEFPDIRKSLTTPLFTHESPFGFNFEDACKKYSAKMEADNAHKTEKEIDGATKE